MTLAGAAAEAEAEQASEIEALEAIFGADFAVRSRRPVVVVTLRVVPCANGEGENNGPRRARVAARACSSCFALFLRMFRFASSLCVLLAPPRAPMRRLRAVGMTLVARFPPTYPAVPAEVCARARRRRVGRAGELIHFISFDRIWPCACARVCLFVVCVYVYVCMCVRVGALTLCPLRASAAAVQLRGDEGHL